VIIILDENCIADRIEDRLQKSPSGIQLFGVALCFSDTLRHAPPRPAAIPKKDGGENCQECAKDGELNLHLALTQSSEAWLGVTSCRGARLPLLSNLWPGRLFWHLGPSDPNVPN
jgi:hypothetical protein